MKKIFLLLIMILEIQISYANNIIDINQGKADPLPLAINDFQIITPRTKSTANKIIDIIKKDLNGSGLFRTISSAAFIEQKTGVEHRPVFAAWQQINSMLLLNAEIVENTNKRVKINFILWDTILEKEVAKQTIEFNSKNWRRVSHKIANVIYKKVTGISGYFDTKITYVAESGDYLKRKRRIAIMDYDGYNHRYLTDGSDLVLSPKFSPDSKKILYLSYKKDIPQVFILDISSKKSEALGEFPGMSFAPRFSNDGKFAVMSISKDGHTHLYEMNLFNKKVRKLTKGKNINTSPSYSPDDSKIAFTSNRNGARQLFVMNRDGSDIERISYGGGAYADPLWSRENLICFTKMSRSIGFSIGIMRPKLYENQNNERLIANGYLVESPAWSGNGQMIIFSRGIKPTENTKKGFSRIYTISFSGYNEKIIPTPNDASQPDWSNATD